MLAPWHAAANLRWWSGWVEFRALADVVASPLRRRRALLEIRRLRYCRRSLAAWIFLESRNTPGARSAHNLAPGFACTRTRRAAMFGPCTVPAPLEAGARVVRRFNPDIVTRNGHYNLSGIRRGLLGFCCARRWWCRHRPAPPRRLWTLRRARRASKRRAQQQGGRYGAQVHAVIVSRCGRPKWEWARAPAGWQRSIRCCSRGQRNPLLNRRIAKAAGRNIAFVDPRSRHPRTHTKPDRRC